MFRVREQFLERNAHFEPGQGRPLADMDAAPPDHAGFGVALDPDRVRVLECAWIAIGGHPHQRQLSAFRYGPPPDLDVPRRGARVGDEWAIPAQDFLDRCGNERGIAPQAFLQVGLLGKMQDQDAQPGHDRSMSGRPVAQDGHDLIVVEPRPVDLDPQQRIGGVVHVR